MLEITKQLKFDKNGLIPTVVQDYKDGAVSVEKSEKLSDILKREGVKHQVLNAKYHEKEASIVAQAGKFGAVTISTNMAGRGTDIMLGGNSEFLAKQEMKKRGYSEELIEQSTAHNETDDEEIECVIF